MGLSQPPRKFKTLLAWAGADDRIRGSLKYGAAHTLRWGGVGPQPQNMKRLTGSPEETEAAIAAVMRGSLKHMKKKYARPLSVLGDVSRPTLVAGPGQLLLGGDYGAIESRSLAWTAGEEWKLAAYRRFDATGNPADEPYVRIASTILDVPPDKITRDQRKVGKNTDLACGYQGGINAYRNFSDEGTDDEVQQLIDGLAHNPSRNHQALAHDRSLGGAGGAEA